MSRLHTMRADVSEAAAKFGVEGVGDPAVPEETIEGGQGLVVFESDGRRIMRSLTCGFPRLTREMRETGDPAGRVGMVADLTNPMWESLVVDPR